MSDALSENQEPDEAEIERLALDLIKRHEFPRRRAAPRLARLLANAEELEVDTPFGPVMAWRLGVGPASLLVHGWEDDNALWSALIEALAGIGRAVVTFDLPGHGFSKARDGTLASTGAAAAAVARALGPIDSVISHSYGCHIGLYALAQGVAAGGKAVMLAPSVPRTGEPSSGGFRKWMVDAGEHPAVAERATQIRFAMTDDALGFSVEPALAALDVQGLILHSLDDDMALPANSERMQELWPGSELVFYDGLGHRRLVLDPAVIERITAFVDDFPG